MAIYEHTGGGGSEHPYGLILEHVAKLQSLLEVVQLPVESIDVQYDHLKEYETATRPNDVYMSGYPAAALQASIAEGRVEEDGDFTPHLEHYGRRTLEIVLEEALSALNFARQNQNVDVACAVSYCLGRLEGTLGKMTTQGALDALIEYNSKYRSENASGKRKLKSEEEVKFALDRIREHLKRSRSFTHACDQARRDISQQLGIDISTRTLTRYWEQEGGQS